jgi:hypothetical protein
MMKKAYAFPNEGIHVNPETKEREMKKTIKLTSLILALFFVAASLSPAELDQAAADQTGFQLLDRLVVLLVKAAAPAGGSGDIGQGIIALAKELKSAREAKRVDDLFAVRYSRLLSAVRQSILMDPEVLYWPMYRYNMVDFIEERTGRIPDWKDLLFIVNDHGGAGVGLGMIADAVMSEVVSLHIYLETLTRRPEILKSYMDKGMKAAGAEK